MKVFKISGFAEYVETDIATSLRASGGDMGTGSENLVLCNFTTGNYMDIDENGLVASTLMARDYKDAQCVVVKCDQDETKGEQSGNGS